MGYFLWSSGREIPEVPAAGKNQMIRHCCWGYHVLQWKDVEEYDWD